jgi:hypothetical protein
MEKLGRRTMGITSTALLTIFIFLIGGLTAGISPHFYFWCEIEETDSRV